jgi:hypothetical protein
MGTVAGAQRGTTALWTVSGRLRIRLFVRAHRCIPGREVLRFRFTRCPGGLVNREGRHECRRRIGGAAFDGARGALIVQTLLSTEGRRYGRCAGCGIRLRSEVRGGLAVAETDMFVVGACFAHCGQLVSKLYLRNTCAVSPTWLFTGTSNLAPTAGETT